MGFDCEFHIWISIIHIFLSTNKKYSIYNKRNTTWRRSICVFQVLNGWKIKYIWKHKSSAIFPWTCQQINHIHVYTRPFKKFLKRLWTWLDRTPLEPGRFCSVPSVSGLIRFSVVACIIRLYIWSLVSNYSLYIIWLATCAIMHNVIILYMDKEVWKMIKHK